MARLVGIHDEGPGGGPVSLDDLTDVVITSPSTGQVLKYDGTNWVNGAGGGGGTIAVQRGDSTVVGVADTLDFTTEFDITESPSGEANIAIGAGISRTGHTHDAGDIASGTFSTSRIADNAVTDPKLADMTDGTVKGRARGAGTGDPQNLTGPQVAAIVAARTTFSNTDHTVTATDRYVAQVGTLTAPRTVTLPAASAVPAGWDVLIGDESGTVTATNTLTIARAGSDTINGLTAITITSPHDMRRLISNGTNGWTAVVPKTLVDTADIDVTVNETADTVTLDVVGIRGNPVHTGTPTNNQGYRWVAANSRFELANLLATGEVTVDRQVFTTSGTWTKPPNALAVYVLAVGAGSGGGSGRCGAAGSNRYGGGGGGSGGVVTEWLRAADCGTTETVTIGAGGTGGAAVGPAAANGNSGGVGGNTSFGSLVVAGGGGLLVGGEGGTAASGAGGVGGFISSRFGGVTAGTFHTVAGGASQVAAAGTGGGAGTVGQTGGGGGGGGGVDSSNVQRAGGGGGNANLGSLTGGSAGTAGGGNGGVGVAPTLDHHFGPGGGGGGGSNSSSVNGGTGGAGRPRGGGGGGGGAGTSGGTATSGAGGNGGNGYCLVLTICARTS